VTAFSGREAERMRGWESAAVILSEATEVAKPKDLMRGWESAAVILSEAMEVAKPKDLMRGLPNAWM
jgi:hypothetical protein